jgi:hypothetical protein
MSKRSLSCAITLAGMALAGPRAALADSAPNLIKIEAGVGGAGMWTVEMTNDPKDGKCKIYTVPPEYSVLKNVTTKEVAELKDKVRSYTFKRPGNYWIVFFPKDRKVAVDLKFIKGQSTSLNTLKVEGTFFGTQWWKTRTETAEGPVVTFSSQDRQAQCVAAHFGKGANLGKPFITLK